MRWVRRGNSRESQDVVGVQEITSMPLLFTVFNNCQSSTSEEKEGNWEINHSGWYSSQHACLVNPWEKYIRTGLRELVGWWIQEADMKLCSLGHRGWAQLPPSLPAHLFHFSASSSILGMQAMVFRSSVTGSIELLNLKMGLWTCKPPILIIWSQACLTWGLMAGIWTEYSWALNLQNLQ